MSKKTPSLKAIFKSRTLRVAFLFAVVGAAETQIGFLRDRLTPEAFGWLTMGFAVVMAALRFMTTTSIAERCIEAEEEDTCK